MQTAVMAINRLFCQNSTANENGSGFVQELEVKVNTMTVMILSLTCKQAFVLKAMTEETSYAKMNAAEQKLGSKPLMRRQTDKLTEHAQQVNENILLYSVRH